MTSRIPWGPGQLYEQFSLAHTLSCSISLPTTPRLSLRSAVSTRAITTFHEPLTKSGRIAVGTTWVGFDSWSFGWSCSVSDLNGDIECIADDIHVWFPRWFIALAALGAAAVLGMAIHQATLFMNNSYDSGFTCFLPFNQPLLIAPRTEPYLIFAIVVSALTIILCLILSAKYSLYTHIGCIALLAILWLGTFVPSL